MGGGGFSCENRGGIQKKMSKKPPPDSDSDSDSDASPPPSKKAKGEPAATAGVDADSMAFSEQEKEAQALAKGLPIKKFKADQVNIDALIAVVGKRRFGKTTFSRWLSGEFKDKYPEVYVFTTTKHNGYWQQHVPEERIYEGLDWPVVESIMDKQKRKIELISEQGEEYTDNPYVLIIFEDVASEKSAMRYSAEILKLAFMGRHYKAAMWFLLQDLKSFNRDVRGNVDFMFTTYLNQHQIMESLQREFCDYWRNPLVFKYLIKEYCQDFGMLCLAQPKAVYKPEDAIFFVEPVPEKPPPFQLGFPMFWRDSGCDWARQLETFARVDAVNSRKPEEWAKLSKEQFKMEKKAVKETQPLATHVMELNSVRAYGTEKEREANGVGVLGKSIMERVRERGPLIRYKPPEESVREYLKSEIGHIRR